MKKFILGGVVVVLLGGYALWSASRSQMPATAIPATTDQTSTNGATNTTTTVTTTTTGNTYKDGTYKGGLGDATPYGQVRVSVTVSGGKLTKVDVLTKPSGPGYTDQLSNDTFPILVKEALSVQSAKVNIVSGATQDSQGFQQSLTAALVAARG